MNAELINIHTIKPLDEFAILKSVKKTKCTVVVEEHQIHGGLGDAICHVLAKNYPAQAEIIGVMDTFGESGTPDQLLEKYGLNVSGIVNAVSKVMQRREGKVQNLKV